MRVLSTSLCLLLLSCLMVNAQDFSDVEITTQKAGGNVYMLQGAGGNIGVYIAENEVFMIDGQFAPLTERILKAIRELSDKPIRFMLNTHWHGDHTDGNSNYQKEGIGIIAHEGVRKRMSEDQKMEFFDREVPASPETARPILTFNDELTLHLGTEPILISHIDKAHTDGDSFVYFPESNVIHGGDVYFEIGYPFIDVSSGGSIEGFITGIERMLFLANDETAIIPGHGKMTDKATLAKHLEMLKTIKTNVQKLIDEGKTLEEVIAAKPTQVFDEEYGQVFIKPDQMAQFVFETIGKK